MPICHYDKHEAVREIHREDTQYNGIGARDLNDILVSLGVYNIVRRVGGREYRGKQRRALLLER